MRPMLKPVLRRVWRDEATLQLGTDPAHAVVLTGLSAQTGALLDLLDGTRERSAVLADAADTHEANRLLELLSGVGVLDDAAADVSPLAALTTAERDRLAPDLAALSLG